MNQSPSGLLKGLSVLSSSATLVGLSWVLSVSAVAQQRSAESPSVDTRLCSTGTQACSVSPATAIRSGGPLSVSASEDGQSINATQESVFEEVADSVNEQAAAESRPVGVDLGPLEINANTPGIGIRDVQD